MFYIDHELEDGRYTIQEIECAEGYLLDTQPKTVYVKYGGCTTITWEKYRRHRPNPGD